MAWQNWWDKQIRRRRLHLWEGGRGVCIPLHPASNSAPECVWNLFGQNKGSLRTQVHEHKSQCNSSTISNITYNMRHIYQDSGYQCRTSAEKSDETPDMASRKFVRLVKNTNRTYGLDTSIGDGRSAQWTQWIWFWTSTLLIVSNFHFSLQAWLRHPARETSQTWEIVFHSSDASTSADCKRGKTDLHKQTTVDFVFAFDWLKNNILALIGWNTLNDFIKPIKARQTLSANENPS